MERGYEMSKKDLVKLIADRFEGKYTQKEVSEIVDTFLDLIMEKIVAGEKVSLFGFGTFTLNERPAHEGWNPSTKEKKMIAAKNTPKFKPAKAFKDATNGVV